MAAAPDATLAAGSAQFDVAAPTTRALGDVDLKARLQDALGDWPAAIPLHSRPLAAVALVRGAVDVVTYGGQGVRGVSTFRYEVDISPEKAARLAEADVRGALEQLDRITAAPTLFADLWVDSEGRIMRVQIPLDPNDPRPRGDSKATVAVVTSDLYDYPKG